MLSGQWSGLRASDDHGGVLQAVEGVILLRLEVYRSSLGVLYLNVGLEQ